MKQAGLAPILIVLIIAAIGLGGYFVYQDSLWETGLLEHVAISPTPSSKESTSSADMSNWKTYTANNYLLKYPESWTIKQTFGGDTTIYLLSDPTTGFSSYYVFIQEIKNPKKLTFTEIATQGTDKSIKSTFKYNKAYSGKYTIFTTTDLPSGKPTLFAYITLDESKYVLLGFLPYDKGIHSAKQDEYKGIFDQILSTFKFTP